MITRQQANSFGHLLSKIPSHLFQTLQKQLHLFASILLQGSVDLWLLRWDTPFPKPFIKLVSTPKLHPFFKFKIPKLLPSKLLKASSNELLKLLNHQRSVKRHTQRRLGQLITHPPKTTISARKSAYAALPANIRSSSISPALRGEAPNQISQAAKDNHPKLTQFFPTKKTYSSSSSSTSSSSFSSS
jgi:hypothetical protein